MVAHFENLKPNYISSENDMKNVLAGPCHDHVLGLLILFKHATKVSTMPHHRLLKVGDAVLLAWLVLCLDESDGQQLVQTSCTIVQARIFSKAPCSKLP